MNVYPDILINSIPLKRAFMAGRVSIYEGEKKFAIKLYLLVENTRIVYT
jgi:hypothetical protein